MTKKIISCLTALFLAMGMFIITPSTTFAESIEPYSSYETSGWFENTYKAPTRSFDGNNLAIQITTHNSNPNYYLTTFTVTLYRQNLIGASKIGEVTVSRSATNETFKWSNIGAGKYYLVFNKAGDGTRQYLDRVYYYNY